MNKHSARPSLAWAGLALLGVLACNLYSPNKPDASQLPGENAEVNPSTVPSETPTIPSETPTLPSATPSVPSATPTIPTSTFTPTFTPSFTPTSTATSKFLHISPLMPLLPLKPILPVMPTKLDYSADATYGEANLTAGFAPDPYSVGMSAGGSVNVSYLGGSCSGFANSAPDLRINFGGGAASLLRIYFVASSADPTMVVNDPYGNFYCVDDSFGTVNPTLDFNNPGGGSYDIWIGAFSTNQKIDGTIYVTGKPGNHP